MPWSSNGTFLVTCTLGEEQNLAVYKPLAGERPLWDFPGGLYRREAAAYVLSRTLGWDLVPETLVREQAPFGAGSLQRFVPADFEQHYFTLIEDPGYGAALRTLCTFDLLCNNADRKAGHCLLGEDGRIWAIDNGLSFHVEPKLRTVIWDFAGESIPDVLRGDLERIAGESIRALDALLEPEEVAAVSRRARDLLADPRFPHPHPDRHHYPWPLV
jgi:hypothetical protein